MKTVLFVCGHNAGRSQMAEAWLNHLAQARGLPVRAISAGTGPADRINSMALDAMQEIGISMEGHFPKTMTHEMVDSADRVISMGCGVDVVACPSKFLLTEDWALDDPADQPIETVRAIRDSIIERVDALLEELSR